MDQYLEIGDANKAMRVFVDENNHIHWTEYPSLVLDGYRHEKGIPKLFTSHEEYEQQKFIFNTDDTIGFVTEPDCVLGVGSNFLSKYVKWVKRGDPNQLVFENAR